MQDMTQIGITEKTIYLSNSVPAISKLFKTSQPCCVVVTDPQ